MKTFIQKRSLAGRGTALFFIAALIVTALSGCTGLKPRKQAKEEPKTRLVSVEKVVVVDFQPALPSGSEPDIVRGPLSGGVFSAEPVPPHAIKKMTAFLLDELVENSRFTIVPPGQARGVLSSLMSTDEKVGLNSVEILQELGTRFSADAVFSGVLYRWREREGTDFAVNRPASVAFELHLLRPQDGAVLWRGRFDKTQQSLSDNLLDMNTFIKAGGRWLTAEKLALGGLKKQLEGLFPPVHNQEGKSN